MRLNDKRNKNVSREIQTSEDQNYSRIITPEGQKELNEIAKNVFKTLHGME